MNFLTCRYFRRTYELKSISKAAASLNISQQSLSQVIATLEAEYGTRLFERTRPLTATEAGEILYNSVCRILDELDSLETRLSGLTGSARLKIGYEVDSSSVIISNAIYTLRKKHPDLDVTAEKAEERGKYDILCCISPDRFRYGEPEEYDCFSDTTAVVMNRKLLNGCFREEAEEVRARLQANKDIRELSGIPFIKLSDKLTENDKDYLGLRFKECGFKPEWNTVSGSFSLMLNLCALGEGAAIMPKANAVAIWNDSPEMEIFDISNPYINWNFHILLRRELVLTDLVRELLSLITGKK